MAQLLYERHSTTVHLNIVKRHIRLARQFKGAEDLVTAIEPSYNELAAKAANTTSVTGETEFKRDLLAFTDVSLDDKVRNLNEACKKYDRDHPGIPVASLLFPDGISPIIYAPVQSEPTLVEKLILGIRSLGEGHPLAEHLVPLQEGVDKSKTAISELKSAITAEKMAEALEAIAKVNLTRQYEQNIYAASSKFGKAYANRLFPPIYTNNNGGNNDETPNPAP
jgi:hypothetical protein